MIEEITRGHIRVKIDGKSLTIQGEALLRGHGSPDFVLYRESIQHWDAPHDSESVDEEMKDRVLLKVRAEMQSERGMTVEIG